ncbi:peroxisomal acyl-coenzyme A oxidase 3 [Leptinotarsa decemlineata]|uniref:peroxisomal acyl-coenzyme A oxidase 3 n=1 Tax=Leptinotarsa decemlineata TaxID=7539 RepID=UPI003D307EC6
MSNLISDFKPGPLDEYRKRASFHWKKLKIFLETEEIIKYQNEVYEVLQSDPDYSTNNSSRTFDDERYLAFKQALALKTLKIFSLERQLSDLKRNNTITRIMVSLNPASFIKSTVGDKLFTSSIMNMGTSRHSKYIDDSNNGKIFGCYCLTEIGHGSNARGMRTTATYDKQKKVFILNSPDFEAAKCWAGGLGQIASYGTVYAQLILDGKNLGLHAFVVPIRNPNTLLPYPGLVVGDMGEKLGLNGIDNGFLKFDNYEIPRENILNRIADVSEDGRYVTSIKDPNKRYGAALGSLSAGRVNIACICETLGLKALTIALRYAAVRKQFGPEGESEIPILEYQSHCLRLIPYLAAAYVLRNFNDYLSEQFFEFMIETMTGNVRPDAPEMGIEIHGVSSSSKPMAGWLMRDAIQESRETCAGHGYLKASGIGDIRNDHDANLTYEGENHVLVQQTSNWLLKLWPLVLQQKSISSPMKSTDFLTNGLNILKNSKFSARNIDETCQPDTIISTYQWLVCYLLKSTANKLDDEIKSGKDLFTAKNDTQVFYAKNLSIAFIQHFFLQRMLVTISKAEDPAIKNVLTKLFSLFGLWALEKYHLPTLYKGEFVVGPMASSLIQDSILKLCLDLKNDAVALIDAIAVPDFILNSILGSSDGMVYKRLQDSMYRNQYCMNRPPWWREVVNWKNNITNKL